MGKQFGYYEEDECGCGREKENKCEKFKKEAKKEQCEALKLAEIANRIAEEAECLDREAAELRRKADELWEKHDKAEQAAIKLLIKANCNLQKYIKCEEREEEEDHCR